MPAQILDRKIDKMRLRVDCHHVRVVRERSVGQLFHTPGRELEHRQVSGLRGNIDQAHRSVVGQDVGPGADLERAADLSRCQVEHQQPVVVLTGDERQAQVGFDQQSVITLRSGQVDPGDDLIRRRIDLDQLPARLHVNKDLP